MDDLLSQFSLEPWSPFTAGLIAALALSRGLDFLSTWLVTPRLELEANPLMRRAGWGRMALINLPLTALPLLHHGLSIALIVTSLLAAGSNLTGGALARGVGEKRQLENQLRALKKRGTAGALVMNSAGSLIVCAGGGFIMALAGPAESRGWWAGLGVVMFGLTGLVHYNLAIIRLGRRARRDH